MILQDVYKNVFFSMPALFKLLKERTPQQSISHKELPTWEQHMEFVKSRPYMAWYLIRHEYGQVLGTAYLSKQREIGIFIFSEFQGLGYGKEAVKLLMETHPGKFLANINPANEPSIRLFKGLGFLHVQNTYASPIGDQHEK